METHRQSSWEHIDLSGVSNDLIFNICLELPADSLLRFKRVCQHWFDVIRDRSFIKMHHIHHNSTHQISRNPSVLFFRKRNKVPVQWDCNIVDDNGTTHTKEMANPFMSMEKFEVIGSCNGLVCFSVDYMICIWNPCTKEYKQFLDGPEDCRGRVEYGFGYDSNIDDYKVVSNTYSSYYICLHRRSLVSVKVYTLGTCSWRRITTNYQNYLCYRSESYNSNPPMYFVNGALYKIVAHSESFKPIIISFDITKEEYQEVTMPIDIHDFFWERGEITVGLGVLNGCLCLVGNVIIREQVDCLIKVWVMKVDDDRVNYSWTQLFSITDVFWRSFLNPLRYWKNDEVLMLKRDIKVALYLYNHQNKKAREVTKLRGAPISGAVTYIGSLVSLQSGTYTGPEKKLAQSSEFGSLYSAPRLLK